MGGDYDLPRGIVEVQEKPGMYCDRCNRSVVAMPAALAQRDRGGLPGTIAATLGRLRGPRNLREWRCPYCLGPVHEGDEPLPSRKKALAQRATTVWELAGWLGGLGIVAALVKGGPLSLLLAIGVGAAFFLLLGALHRADEPFEAKPAPNVHEREWLDDARASYGRGTDISTLAVRYDVEPEWLEKRLRARP